MNVSARYQLQWKLAAREPGTRFVWVLSLVVLLIGALTTIGLLIRRDEGIAALMTAQNDVRQSISEGWDRTNSAEPPANQRKNPRDAAYWLHAVKRTVHTPVGGVPIVSTSALAYIPKAMSVQVLDNPRALTPPALLPHVRMEAMQPVTLALVLVWIVPLMMIALTYDCMASLRETQKDALVVSSGLRFRTWLTDALVVRQGPLLVIVVLVFAGACLGSPSEIRIVELTFVGGILLAYYVLWGAWIVMVNTSPWTGMTNLMVLLALWLVGAVMVPLGLEAGARFCYPAASKSALILAIREASVPVRTAGAKLLQQYYEDHPELAGNDVDLDDFTMKYVAVRQHVDQAVQPILDDHRATALRRDRVLHQAAWLSPGLVVSQLLDAAAGSDYAGSIGLDQAMHDEREIWRKRILSALFQKRPMSESDLHALNQPEPIRHASLSSQHWIAGFGLWMVALTFAGIARRRMLGLDKAH